MEMKKFIGIKIIDGMPMTLGQYNIYRGWEIPQNEDPDKAGYLVEYNDPNGKNHPDHKGYISWSPADQMENFYLEIEGDGTRILPETVDIFLNKTIAQQIDEKTTHVKAITLSGFVQHEMSSCVDPANYDGVIGAKIATDKIKDTLWQCLGFVLQWGKDGLKKGPTREDVGM